MEVAAVALAGEEFDCNNPCPCSHSLKEVLFYESLFSFGHVFRCIFIVAMNWATSVMD